MAESQLNAQLELMKIALAWLCVFGFGATLILSICSLVGWVRFTNPAQQKTLFKILIVEIVIISVGYFSSLLTFGTSEIEESISRQARKEELQKIYEDAEKINNYITENVLKSGKFPDNVKVQVEGVITGEFGSGANFPNVERKKMQSTIARSCWIHGEHILELLRNRFNKEIKGRIDSLKTELQ